MEQELRKKRLFYMRRDEANNTQAEVQLVTSEAGPKIRDRANCTFWIQISFGRRKVSKNENIIVIWVQTFLMGINLTSSETSVNRGLNGG